MTRTALDITEVALSFWRTNHGNESLDQQCQRFDGYYWQWAWAGSERGIVPYSTATAAANASSMYSRDINSSSAKPGHLANWWWNPDGHVGTVLGRDTDGRVLVSHTSSKGDTVRALSNNVKISHADTINLSFRGYSRTNGANNERLGVLAWPQEESFIEELDIEGENMSKPMLAMKLDGGKNHTLGVMIDPDGFVTELDKDQWGFWTSPNFNANIEPIECKIPGQWEYLMGVMQKRRERSKK